jgi:uridine phosphorylase
MTLQELPLTGAPAQGLPPDAIVCGDPGRAEKVTSFLHAVRLASDRREYRCFVGQYKDMPVLVCSHGIGAPGAAIAFEELARAGVRRMIRVGTCGALQPDIEPGHLIIAEAAVQNTGYGRETVPSGYPAVADFELTLALKRSVDGTTHAYRRGIVLSRDNFYRGVEVVSNPDYAVMSEAKVLAVEMECAALFLVGSMRGVQTAAILAVDGNVLANSEQMETYDPGHERVQAAVDAEIQIALGAMRMLYNDAG